MLERLRELKVDAIFSKPFNSSALLGTIQKVMKKKVSAVLQSEAEDLEPVPPIERVCINVSPPPLRILLAEDNPMNQEVATIRLKKQGHTVVVAGDGVQAVSAYQKEPFDLILMDVHMPNMDGIEATKRIRKLEEETGGHIPIVALTASAMKGDRERLQAAGMDEHVAKPIQTQELFDAMDRVTQRTRKADSKVADQKEKVGSSLNKEDLLAGVEGDKGLLKHLIETWKNHTPKMLDELREGFEHSDFNRIRYAAHTLKGSLGTFGAKAGWDVAQRLEESSSSGDIDSGRQLFELLKVACQEVTRELDRLWKEIEA
jgi:CheY-like chemotaxis protein